MLFTSSNRKSTPASALARWPLHQVPFGLIGSQTLDYTDKTKNQYKTDFYFAIKNSPGCLGFAPCSNSLVYEPTVLPNSIFSLSGLASRRPSANPLDSHQMLLLVSTKTSLMLKGKVNPCLLT